jgi:hypothetical protein
VNKRQRIREPHTARAIVLRHQRHRRSGFVAEENIDKSPTEIMIERVIKREVENLLEKAGLVGRKGVA